MQDNPQLTALRQSIIALPEFHAWHLHVEEERRAATAHIASREASSAMTDYMEFIEAEAITLVAKSHDKPEKTDYNMNTCEVCGGKGYRNTASTLTIDCYNCQGRGVV